MTKNEKHFTFFSFHFYFFIWKGVRNQKMFCVLRPGRDRLSKCSSSVRRIASKTMEVAATMLSGSLSLVERRNSMAFFSIFSFIADSPLVRNAVSTKNALARSKEPRKRLAVRVGGFFFRHLQGFLNSAGVTAGQRSSVKFSFWRPFGGSRTKGKHNRPRRYFAGHVNSQPVAGRYLYGLRYGHGESIA